MKTTFTTMTIIIINNNTTTSVASLPTNEATLSRTDTA